MLERGIEVHALLEGLVLAERGLRRDHARDRRVGRRRGAAARRPRPRARPPPAGAGLLPAGRRRDPGEVNERAEARQAGDVRRRAGLARRAAPSPCRSRSAARAARPLARRSPAAPASIGDLERLLARQAAMVVALELMRERAVRRDRAPARRRRARRGARRQPRRRGAARPPAAVRDRRPGRGAAVRARDVGRRPERCSPRCAPPASPPSSRSTAAAGRPLLCAIVDPGERDPVELAREGRAALGGAGRRGPAAASRPARSASLRRAFHEARCALEATAMANGNAPDVASHRDLGAFTLLLSLQDDDALRTYSENLLGPISEGEGEYGPELLRSLEAFIERNGQWERAARDLYCHRHTLRYRIRQDRGADRPRPRPGPGPDRALARAAGAGAGEMRQTIHGNDTTERGEPMKVGVPTEIKEEEYRVALTAVGARELAEHGHEVLIQQGAGEGSAISDDDYEAQGARIVADRRGRLRARPTCCSRSRSRSRSRSSMLRARDDAVHLPAPGAGTRADRGPLRDRRDLHRLRDRRGRAAAGCPCSRR